MAPSFIALALLATPCVATLWPQPASLSIAKEALPLSPTFAFAAAGLSNDILTAAFARYDAITSLRALPATPWAGGVSTTPLSTLAVTLHSASESLNESTSEAYTLAVVAPTATLIADTVFGALRGLEAFSQLVEYTGSTPPFLVVAATITDAPRFAHRGVLVDTGRHYIPLPGLLSLLDAMAYNSLNVFHWHLVDDQSFPFVSSTFPRLSAEGSFGKLASHTYSPADVATVIAYATQRGIRVMPELDTPGHSLSWGGGALDLLTPCFTNTTPPHLDGTFGPIDPTRNSTYEFLRSLFSEVAAVFPEKKFHIGGDEVSFACWASNPSVNEWMRAHGIAGNYTALESYYVQRVLSIVTDLGKDAVGWEELFDNGLTLPPRTIVNVWKYHNGPTPPAPGAKTWQEEIARVTAAGFFSLLSSPWYLNVITYGVDWPSFYNVEPLDWPGSNEQKALVVGGELSMWGEYVDAANLISRLFPRASAVAERLWSPASVTNITDATLRINDQRCRLIARGLPAGALTPGYCPTETVVHYVPPWAPAGAAPATPPAPVDAP